MTDHLLTRTIVIKRPREEVFEFFADASNLEQITPPELNFHILTPLPIEMRTGTLIDYQLRLYGFPMKWRTEITLWQPPEVFVDTQLKGPYQKWVHRHTFTEIEGRQTQIDDEVIFRLPLEPLSLLGLPLIRRQLDYIFDYRQKKVAELLG
ncbi:MAG: SRPBCC family protein [Pyrinomonadaceae bacterium]|jgi:ligand-binding SRPBCC domain-containing protein